MSRFKFFLITSAAIFFMERFLPTLASWPVFIYPIFVVIFMLSCKNNTGELSYIVAVSFVFDFFSGYRLGFFTFAILFLALAIFLFKTRFNISQHSLLSFVVYTIIFIFAYFAIFSIGSSSRLIVDRFFFIIIETAAVFLIINFLLRYVKN
ncbi:MAG: hypothetical protein HYT61_01735 [Candidatus Yanofskybacteria bacterium]|nr:hypothetical protein [Candidatus Yanofskybacteria bacterium]